MCPNLMRQLLKDIGHARKLVPQVGPLNLSGRKPRGATAPRFGFPRVPPRPSPHGSASVIRDDGVCLCLRHAPDDASRDATRWSNRYGLVLSVCGTLLVAAIQSGRAGSM